MSSAERPLLSVEHLSTAFTTSEGEIRAVDDVSFFIAPGETVGLVGESGCGKSVTALSILRLIPSPPGKVISGKILFEGTDLLSMPLRELRKIRGHRVAMIFQEPMTSLNPVFTVGSQVAEAVLIHEPVSRREAWNRAVEMLSIVGIPDATKRAKDYPHQLSGGMRQRVMIAMALVCNPKLLIADEPTTALDVTIQAQILDLMRSLQERFQMSILLITHDIGVVAEMCRRVLVMYAGRIIEEASVERIFSSPRHPYTRGLQDAIPRLEMKYDRLKAIPGIVPSLLSLPPGCRFSDRCPRVVDECRAAEPALLEMAPGQHVRCINPVPSEGA